MFKKMFEAIEQNEAVNRLLTDSGIDVKCDCTIQIDGVCTACGFNSSQKPD